MNDYRWLTFLFLFNPTAGGKKKQVLHISRIFSQLAKMSFDKIFDLTAGVYFNFYNIFVLSILTLL